MDELNLFEVESGPRKVKKELKMSFEQLRDWKLRIANYQKSVRRGEQNVVQTSLFKTQSSHCDPDLIDPCSLSLHSMAFYRLPSSECSQAALYFVIDSIENIILYIGETSQISRRWRTVHKCKDYLSSYQDLHYRYQLPTAINIAFWWDVPLVKRHRQNLEHTLIQKWRSPFNKENWGVWSQPFK